MKALLFSMVLTLSIYLCSFGQTGLSKGDFNKLLNNAFNKLVSSNPSAGVIASYATIDPINAAFNVKGTFPLQQSDKRFKNGKSFEEQLKADQGNISYLSFTLSGALMDKSYAALFSNSSLNTGVDLEVQYNFRLCKPGASWSENETNDVDLKKEKLLYAYHQAVTGIENSYSDSSYNRTRYLLGLQKGDANVKLSAAVDQLDLVQKSVDSVGTAITDNPTLADSLQKQSKAVTAAKTTLASINAQIDSVDMVSANSLASYRANREGDLQTKLRHDYDSVLLLLSFKRIKIAWLPCLAGIQEQAIPVTIQASSIQPKLPRTILTLSPVE